MRSMIDWGEVRGEISIIDGRRQGANITYLLPFSSAFPDIYKGYIAS